MSGFDADEITGRGRLDSLDALEDVPRSPRNRDRI
jgi:hypothetical protein